MATAPEFIERNAQAIIDRITTTYQGLTGKILRPAQPEALFIQAVAYEILLLREVLASNYLYYKFKK